MTPEIALFIAAASLVFVAVGGFAAATLILRLQKERAVAAGQLAVAEERLRAAEGQAGEAAQLRAERQAAAAEVAALKAELSGLRAKGAEDSAARDKAASESAALRAEGERLRVELAREQAEGRARQQQLAELKDAREQMRLAFANDAGTLMTSHSETFKTQNKEAIEQLLKPLRGEIETFKKSLGDAHVESARQHGSLKTQIEQLARQSAVVSKEAENLARALKGDTQMQGAWGEMKIETILQRLGLQEGEEYSRQECFSDAEGRVRTDFILNLPQGERLIIDSKVSLLDFEAYVNAGDDETQAARLAAHARSMRAHVKGLASKEYYAKVGTRLDFVIMFVPIEAAFAAALRADEALLLDALDLKVAIATPTTLATQMKTVAAMWRVERQNQNAEDIANRAGALYDKFVNFVGDLEKIGERIGQAHKLYESALGKLSVGPGNLVRQTEMLKALGASAAKSLPASLVEAASASGREAVLRLSHPLAEEAPAAAMVNESEAAE